MIKSNCGRLSFALLLCVGVVFAQIPEPDAILYGQVRISGALQTAANTDVIVFARVLVSGSERQVGLYRMGDNSAAGDRYVLRIRLESLADGSTQSANAALVGQTARIYIKRGTEPEQYIRDFVITRAGVIQNLDLDTAVDSGNCSSPAPSIDLQDYSAFRNCITGVIGDASTSCECADFDGDGNVDLADWRFFQNVFGNS